MRDSASTRPVRLAPLDLLTLGLIGLRTRKVRATLSALGISIGIATMVVVTGIPASSNQALQAELSALGTNILQAAAPPQSAAGEGQKSELPTEAPAMVARIGPVQRVSAVGNTHTAMRRSDKAESDDGVGLTVLAGRPDLLPLVHGRLSSGRWLDVTSTQLPVVVLGAVTAIRLGIGALVPGNPPPQVLIAEHWYTVAGILAPVALSPDLDLSAVVGWQSAEHYLRFDGHPTVIYVQAYESSVEQVQSVLSATINPAAPGDVVVTRPSDALAAKRATQSAFASLFLGLAGVALLVGGIGVANTMVISVLERRSEIGLRRALGANRGQIRGQFLTESVVLSLLGGIAGTALGAMATACYASYQSWPVVLSWTSTSGGLAGAAVIGVVAGVYPSMRAARLTPTAALATS
jgi:putative ABC transport system permease protein